MMNDAMYVMDDTCSLITLDDDEDDGVDSVCSTSTCIAGSTACVLLVVDAVEGSSIITPTHAMETTVQIMMHAWIEQ
jgi:hypothetical protein